MTYADALSPHPPVARAGHRMSIRVQLNVEYCRVVSIWIDSRGADRRHVGRTVLIENNGPHVKAK